MGEIKEKKNHHTFCLLLLHHHGKIKKNVQKKKKSIYECAMHDSKGFWEFGKEKENLTYDKAAGHLFTPSTLRRWHLHPPHPTPGFPYP